MLSKLDALIIGVLSLGGTGAMVEDHHRTLIAQPDAVAIVENQPSVPKTTNCAIISPSGEFLYMHYLMQVGDAMTEDGSAVFCRGD